jgi:hypothetical protein
MADKNTAAAIANRINRQAKAAIDKANDELSLMRERLNTLLSGVTVTIPIYVEASVTGEGAVATPNWRRNDEYRKRIMAKLPADIKKEMRTIGRRYKKILARFSALQQKCGRYDGKFVTVDDVLEAQVFSGGADKASAERVVKQLLKSLGL